MAEITGPIIAITLVLLSVFVPVAFIPGVSGTLFRQFAVTISVAMLISTVNALTLSPALCAVFLRHQGTRRGPMGWILGRIESMRDGYAAIVSRLVRVSALGIVAILGSAVAIFGLSLVTPTGFLPEEDQGAFFISVQLPDGASVARTSEAVQGIERLLRSMPQVQNIFAIVGYSIVDSVNEPNTGFVVPTLKPFADRVGAANSAQALIGKVFSEGQQIRAATVIPFNLPPIIGLSTTGGFEYELEALEGQDPATMNSVMQGIIANANRDPRLNRVFSTYTASNPSIYLDIDREKAQALGLGMNDVFAALQVTLGGFYINNFNLFGRIWQVNIQGEAADRNDVSSLWQIYVRNKYGAAVPLRSIANARVAVGPQVITRYNNYRAIPIQGSPSPGTSSGTALDAMADVSRATLPAGYGYEWTGTAYQEVSASGQTGALLGLAVMFAFLFLVGLSQARLVPQSQIAIHRSAAVSSRSPGPAAFTRAQTACWRNRSPHLDNFSAPCRLAENASAGAAMAGPSLPRPPALQLHLGRTGPIGPDRRQYNLPIRGWHHDASYAISGADGGMPAVQFQLSTLGLAQTIRTDGAT
jgi:multidrug efflux pump subunit AcrB